MGEVLVHVKVLREIVGEGGVMILPCSFRLRLRLRLRLSHDSFCVRWIRYVVAFEKGGGVVFAISCFVLFCHVFFSD